MGFVNPRLEERLDDYSSAGNPSVHVRRIENVQDHAAARNSLVLWHFDAVVYTHICFLDADMEPPAQFLERMLAVEKPAVSGVSHVWRSKSPGRSPEPLLALWKRRTQPDGSDTYDRCELAGDGHAMFEDPGLATGCFGMLVEGWVFERLRERFGLPWFKTEYVAETQEKALSEDIFLCRNLERLDIPVTILPDLVFGHRKTVSLADVAEYGRTMEEKGRLDALDGMRHVEEFAREAL